MQEFPISERNIYEQFSANNYQNVRLAVIS